MFPLLSDDDRENMTRVWQVVMPAEVFGGAIQLVHQAIGDDFAELSRRIPDLTPEPETTADVALSVSAATAEVAGARS